MLVGTAHPTVGMTQEAQPTYPSTRLPIHALSRHQLTGPQLRPLTLFCNKAVAADDVKLLFNPVIEHTNVGVDRRIHRLKAGGIGQMRLSVQLFHRVVSGAAIDVVAVYTNAHSTPPAGTQQGQS